VTVHPLAGHVTLQSSDPPQSTRHDTASAHSTWQSPLASHVTSTGPAAPWTWHEPADVQVCVHASLPVQAQASPVQEVVSLVHPSRKDRQRAKRIIEGSFGEAVYSSYGLAGGLPMSGRYQRVPSS